MARDSGSDKPSKKRWGRGNKPEEGPSEDELGWLADLRGAREERATLGSDEPTGTVTRPRRGAKPAESPGSAGRVTPPTPPMPATPTNPPTPATRINSPTPPTAPAPPAAPREPRRRLIKPKQAPPTPPPESPAVVPTTPPPVGGAPSRRGLRRTPPAPIPVPPEVPSIPVPPAVPPPMSSPQPTPPGPIGQPRSAGAGKRAPATEQPWHDQTGDVPRVPGPPIRTGEPPRGRPRAADPRLTDPRLADPRLADPRLADPRLADPRLADPRLANPRLTDPRLADPRLADPRLADPRLADPRLTYQQLAELRPGGRGAAVPSSPSKLRRAEMRRQIRIAQQLKGATLIVVALLLLAAFPVYLWIRSVAQDPVFGELDALDLPTWAAGVHSDAASGSRWCIDECRFRERTWESQRGPDETQIAYNAALRGAGWRLRTEGLCPTVQDGVASCWRHDEFVLDMWVRAPVCPPPRPAVTPKPSGPAAAPSGTAAPPAAGPPQPSCPGALVTVKVFNAIGYRLVP